jgi:Flp pilus assembly protein TadD
VAQGRAALKTKQYPEAVRLFTEAKGLSPDAEVAALLGEANFQAKLQLGRQRIEANDFASAIPDLEEAVRLRPDHAEGRDLLRRATEGKGRQDKADRDRALAAGDAAVG